MQHIRMSILTGIVLALSFLELAGCGSDKSELPIAVEAEFPGQLYPEIIGVVPPVDTKLTPFAVTNVEQVEQLAQWGKGKPLDVAYSPDGSELAVVATTGIYFYDAHSRTPVGSIDTAEILDAFAWSPDGQQVAVGLAQGDIGIYAKASGATVQTLSGHSAKVGSLAFSPDGALLVSSAVTRTNNPDGALDGSSWVVETNLWRLSDSQIVCAWSEGDTTLTNPDTTSVAFNADGTLVAGVTGSTGTRSAYLEVWHTDDCTGKETLSHPQVRYQDAPDSLDHVAWTANNNVIAVANSGGIDLWRGPDEPSWINPAARTVYDLDYAAARHLLAAATSMGLRLWRLSPNDEPEDIQLLNIPANQAIRAVAFSPDGDTIATIGGTGAGAVQIWQSDPPTPAGLVEHSAYGVVVNFWSWAKSSLAINPDSSQLAIALPSTVAIGNIADGGTVTPLPLAMTVSDTIEGIWFSPGGDTLAAFVRTDLSNWESNYFVRFWTPPGDPTVHAVDSNTQRGDRESISTAAFSNDGSLFAGVDQDGLVRIWSTTDGVQLHEIESGGAITPVIGLAFDPAGESLLVRYLDGVEEEWRLGSEQRINMRRWIDADVAARDDYHRLLRHLFSPQGSFFASEVNTDNWWDNVDLWDVRQGRLITRIDLHKQLGGLAFDPTELLLAVGLDDGGIALINIQDGALLQTLYGHTAVVSTLMFSVDGTLLVSAAEDGTVRVWGIPES